MGELIVRALRSPTVLYSVGVAAAIIAFALVALPGGKPAAAAPLYPAYSVGMDNVGPTTLSLSHTEVIPNQSIVIWGRGFGQTPGNTLASARIGGVDLMVVSHGGILADVAVSPTGQFNATFAIWPADPGDGNPTLGGGTLELEIMDAAGLVGTTDIAILPPTLTVAPDVVGPRHNVHITGANWPAANPDGGAVSPVNIQISGGGIAPYTTQKAADANGKWYVGYRVPDDVSIPATLNVTATYGSDISQSASFNVMAVNLTVKPAEAWPAVPLMLNASGFAPNNSNITVKIGPSSLPVPADAATDGAGRIKDLAITMPALDSGDYTVQLIVGGDSDTIAIGAVTMMVEYIPGNAPLPDALESLGDNLARVFHFDPSDQTWSFYDPRPEFAELNTLTLLSPGQYYWLLMRDNACLISNFKIHNLTCRNGNCWNRIVW